MADIIQLLPDHVANQIAAGEVVQRPASVVKELMENAIDADATKIILLVKDAGKTLIQVIDNGKGMSTTDARLCFERHATSKIRAAQDLFNLHTKGFRGEALASIAAIAHVELKTKTEDQEVGTHIKIEGSKVLFQEATTTPTGSSIQVKNLFYNIPARRNFLKSDGIEMRHVLEEFQRVALTHPDIEFVLQHNNTEVYQLQKSNLRKRIVAIFGSKINEKLVPIQEDTEIVRMDGFVAKPQFAKKKRGEQFFFVNNRFVKSPYLHHAIVSAFDGLLEQGTHPSYFLYLTVPPQSIDINIHPTKTEIKFDNEKDVYAIIRATVKHSLGQYNIAPVLDFNRDATLDTPYNYNAKQLSAPTIQVDPTFNPFEKESSKKTGMSFSKRESEWEALYSSANTEIPEPQQEALFTHDDTKTVGTTFQIQKKYVLSSIKSGIVLIHQSLAHQRIIYERFLKTLTVTEGHSQQLLFPLQISFQPSEIELIYTVKSELESTGFVFGEFTKESIVVTGIPTQVTESQVSAVLEQLVADMDMDIPDAEFNYAEMLASSFSKTLCLKTGQSLSEKEQEMLVHDLFSCVEPSVAPNGKATFKTLTLAELDQLFIQ